MDDTNYVLLGLLRRALFGQPFSMLKTEMDWTALYREARAHAVHLLLYDSLTQEERSSMPVTVEKQWRTCSLQTLQKNLILLMEQERMIKVLNEESISCAVFKGSAIAANYPRPELRCSGDIDLWVKKTDLISAKLLLEKAGYVERAKQCAWHLTMQREHFIIELHFAPAGIPNGKRGEGFYQYFQSIPQLDFSQQAVALLLHKLNHIRKDGLGLRHLCDWALFVQKNLDEVTWRSLEPQLKAFGLLHFAKIITRICTEYLGLPKCSVLWCMDGDKTLTEALLQDVLQTGNFGCKEARYGQRLFTDGGAGGRLGSLWRTGINACKTQWPACQKTSVLIPLAPFVLMARRLKQKEALYLWDSFQKAKPRQTLYRSLKPFLEDSSAENEL